MTGLKNNQIEISLRYTGSDPEEAFRLARVSMTFKGFSFEDMKQPVKYEENDGEYTATLIGTNQFLPEYPQPKLEEKPVSIMNNAPLSQSKESVG